MTTTREARERELHLRGTHATSRTHRTSRLALHSSTSNTITRSAERHRHASDAANKSFVALVAGHAKDVSRRVRNAILANLDRRPLTRT